MMLNLKVKTLNKTYSGCRMGALKCPTPHIQTVRLYISDLYRIFVVFHSYVVTRPKTKSLNKG